MTRMVGKVCFEVVDRNDIVCLQDLHEIGDVRRGEAQGFDFRQLSVRGNIGDALPEVAERVVDALRTAALLLVGCIAAFHNTDDGQVWEQIVEITAQEIVREQINCINYCSRYSQGTNCRNFCSRNSQGAN